MGSAEARWRPFRRRLQQWTDLPLGLELHVLLRDRAWWELLRVSIGLQPWTAGSRPHVLRSGMLDDIV